MDFLLDNSTTPQDPPESQLNDIAEVRSQLLEAQLNIEEFRTHICGTVSHMLQDLCKRDNRFLYLRDALVEFIDGDLGLNDRLGGQTQHVELALSMDGDDDNPMAATRMLLKWLIHNRTLFKQDIFFNSRFDFRLAGFEIISSVIFEILNVFDLDIDVEEFMIPHELPAYAALLNSLYHKTRDCKPKVATRKTTPNTPYQALSEFIYKSKLSPETDQVRVVEICPGSLDEPIECNLKVRSIKDDGIPEALSYVWGTEISHEDIFVDLQLFSVTKNLFEILRSLRHPNTTRTIWIDAICINQSDFEEKGRQVRLMRDIYSNAKGTVIYLTGGGLQCQAADEPLVSIPPNLGGTTIDRYDLASILTEFRKYPLDSPWSCTQLALYLMLLACVKEILSHVWWERIWTLQEGALPPSTPMIYYRDHSFTFDDVEAAIDILRDIGKWGHETEDHILGQVSRDPTGNQVLSTFDLVRTRLNERPPLLYYLRRHGQDYGKESSAGHGTFYKSLWDTDTYRATNPRDKIYALESLLPRCAGKLIRIDYDEDYETVFTCATARCVNSTPTLAIAGKFSLLIERKTNTVTKDLSISDPESHSAPSWTMDFSYCASEKHINKYARAATDLVTLHGFLYEQSDKYRKNLDRSRCQLMFATPRTLFCSGVDIDRIYETGKIPEIGPGDLFLEVFFLAVDIKKRLRSRLPNLKIPDSSIDLRKEAIQLIAFFSLQPDEKPPPGDFEGFLNVRFKEIAGRPYFITEQGLVGISTAPVQQGDSLCLLHDACVYFVLRDVPDQGTSESDSKPEAAQKHRIVARAAVQETTDIPSLMASLPSRRFQII
ncbi:heterokaryon incompatibility protein-domain-containing protein [Xylaria flabelliformis]|nr:heterokaryon incompatibility protein-domain-containing protein [Xylaria flabelliformis]